MGNWGILSKTGAIFFAAATFVLLVLAAIPQGGAHAQNINVAVTDFTGTGGETYRVNVTSQSTSSGYSVTASSGVDDTGRTIGQIVGGALSSLPGVTVVDRQNLEGIMREQRLNISGFVDMSSLSSNEVGALAQVGQLAGATHLVTGAYSFSGGNFTLTINLINIATGAVEDFAVASSAADEYFASVLRASNRFAGKVSGKSLNPMDLFGKLELIVNVEWAGGELLCDPRTDLKARVEQATGMPVSSRDITGEQVPGTITQMFKDDATIAGALKLYATGMNPILLVNFQPIEGPSSADFKKYKARMYWAAYYPALGGAVNFGVVETPDFGGGINANQSVSQAVTKTYDLFTANSLYKIVGDFGSAGARELSVVINGVTRQDHLALKSALQNQLGITAFKQDYFNAGESLFRFEWSKSIDDVKNALLGTNKVSFVSMDNVSIKFRKRI